MHNKQEVSRTVILSLKAHSDELRLMRAAAAEVCSAEK